jgi:predicted nucleotide-binding protein
LNFCVYISICIRAEIRNANQIPIETEKPSNSDQIFIVHGHDTASKLELARLIKIDFGHSAIILYEQANTGNTIIEKLERLSELAKWMVSFWRALNKVLNEMDSNTVGFPILDTK